MKLVITSREGNTTETTVYENDQVVRKTIKFDKAKYDKQYAKENTQQIKFVLNKNLDADIIEWLGTKTNKQGYIKDLIRRDMEQKSIMAKAFDNVELWWVTGAQLLYGGDAVGQVDGRLQEMIAYMLAVRVVGGFGLMPN